MIQIPKIEAPEFAEGFHLMNALVADLRDTVNLRGKLRDDLWRRVVVRVLFSTIESIVSHARGRALTAASCGTVSLTEKAKRTLLEGQFETLDDGTIVWTTIYPRLKDTIRCSLRYYAKALETGTPLQAAAPWPEGFDEVLRVRHSITHPKRLGDLAVTDSQMESVSAIVTWVMKIAKWIGENEQEHIITVGDRINRSVDEQIQELKRGKEPTA